MKTNLSCIILFVKDVEKLKTFYINDLHLELKEEIISEWVLLKAGQCEIGLHKAGSEYADKTYGCLQKDNNTKIVLDIDTDIYLLREHLIGKNVSLREIKTWDGFDYIICDGEDPEGNVFQLRQRKNN